MCFKKTRILTPISLAHKYGLSVITNNVKYQLDAKVNCTICNYQTMETNIIFFALHYIPAL